VGRWLLLRTVPLVVALAILISPISSSIAAPAAAPSKSTANAGNGPGQGDDNKLRQIQHIVVIYEENHSFDNLYGGWEGVNGLSNADVAHTTQINQAGTQFQCLYMDDLNLQAQ